MSCFAEMMSFADSFTEMAIVFWVDSMDHHLSLAVASSSDRSWLRRVRGVTEVRGAGPRLCTLILLACKLTLGHFYLIFHLVLRYKWGACNQ